MTEDLRPTLRLQYEIAGEKEVHAQAKIFDDIKVQHELTWRSLCLNLRCSGVVRKIQAKDSGVAPILLSGTHAMTIALS